MLYLLEKVLKSKFDFASGLLYFHKNCQTNLLQFQISGKDFCFQIELSWPYMETSFKNYFGNIDEVKQIDHHNLKI